MIHPTAIVSADTPLDDAQVGAYVCLGVDGEGGPLRLGAGARIRSHSVLYRNTVIGQRFQTGHGALVRDQCVIGDDVSVGSHATVEFMVTMGNGVRLHSGVFVPEYSVLEDGAWLGPGVIVTNSRYPGEPDAKSKLEGVHVEAGAHIGAGAVLLPGVRIGRNALVGAGAVVVKDIPPDARVVGNPGRQIS